MYVYIVYILARYIQIIIILSSVYIYIYIYMYISYIYIYIYVYICIILSSAYELCTSCTKVKNIYKKPSHLFFEELYFEFFQTFKDSINII